MSERELQMSGVVETPQSTPVTAGQRLRTAREAAGLHVAALAGALKVPVHKLEALEADDYAAFPDTVFMRALASSICRTLGLDAQPILDQLPRSVAKGFDAQRMHLNAPIKARSGKGGGMSAGGGGLSRKAIGSVVLLLLAAAIVYFLPNGLLDGDGAEDSAPTTLSLPVDPGAQPAAVAAWGGPAAALPTAPLAQSPVANEPAPTAVAVPAPVAEQPAVADGTGALLAFSATATSWIQVKDARGAVILEKTLKAGESVQASADLPVSVVVGSADRTNLLVRGQAFDLAAVARNNVARFEVKQ